MKAILKCTLVVVSFFLLATPGCQAGKKADALAGRWEGLFMQDFPTTLEFTLDGKSIGGRIILFDGPVQIQDDPLSEISLKKDRVSFHIAAKDTRFNGTLRDDGSEITGVFIFPDGSEHPLTVRLKKEEPT